MSLGSSCTYHIEHKPTHQQFIAQMECDAATVNGISTGDGTYMGGMGSNGDVVVQFQAQAGKTYTWKSSLVGHSAVYAGITVYPDGALQQENAELQAQASSMLGFASPAATRPSNSDTGFGGGELIVGTWGGTTPGDVTVAEAFHQTAASFREDLKPKKYFPGQTFGSESTFSWTCPGTGLYLL
jgi:hypothetical protein